MNNLLINVFLCMTFWLGLLDKATLFFDLATKFCICQQPVKSYRLQTRKKKEAPMNDKINAENDDDDDNGGCWIESRQSEGTDEQQ